jgi:hypothetical protein
MTFEKTKTETVVDITERNGQVVNTSASYSEVPG